jgi:hypothetical protein
MGADATCGDVTGADGTGDFMMRPDAAGGGSEEDR